MINNVNYNPFYTDPDAITRYENRKSRMLVDNRKDHEVSKPEGFCTTCKGFTTNYSSRGECSDCGTELVVDIPEKK